MAKKKRIYGPVNSTKDIVSINKKIRAEVRSAKSKDRLTELKRRSRYLIVLTHGPAMKKKFKGRVKSLRTRAKSEYKKTTKLVESRRKSLGIPNGYKI